MGAGGIFSKEDARLALKAGYDLLSVAKAHLVNPDFVNILKNNRLPETVLREGDDERLSIPHPLWNILGFLKSK